MTLRATAASKPSGASPIHADYQKTFVQHVLKLIGEGYRLLDVPTLQTKEETAITGLLVDAIEGFIETMCASPQEHWSWRYAVHDDRPESTGGEEGKKRPRVDIRIEALYENRRPRMPFEAKRLHSKSGVTPYFGSDGMGCFLSEKYGVGCPDVVMLGYTQSQTVSYWEKKVKGEISTNQDSLGVLPEEGKCFCDVSASEESSHFYSVHSTNPSGANIVINHILLKCC